MYSVYSPPPIPQIGRYNKMYKQIHNIHTLLQVVNTIHLTYTSEQLNVIIEYYNMIWYNFVKCSSTGCSTTVVPNTFERVVKDDKNTISQKIFIIEIAMTWGFINI